MKKKYSSNGILLECHDANKVRRKIALKPHTLIRTPSGSWTFKFDIDFAFAIGDGRTVEGKRRISIGNITQTGRKPRTRKA